MYRVTRQVTDYILLTLLRWFYAHTLPLRYCVKYLEAAKTIYNTKWLETPPHQAHYNQCQQKVVRDPTGHAVEGGREESRVNMPSRPPTKLRKWVSLLPPPPPHPASSVLFAAANHARARETLK